MLVISGPGGPVGSRGTEALAATSDPAAVVT